MSDESGGAEPVMRLEVSLDNPNGYREARARSLGPWLRDLIGEIAPQTSSFAVRFVGDRAMRKINREFRGKDRTTDVLSFPGEETPEGRHLGDVAISIPAARRQAHERGERVEREVRILLVHGVLHCLGYDHESDDGEMHRVEERVRSRWLEAG